MNRIVECVPNFSEGRRTEVVDAIVEAMLSVPDVYLLDRKMDADHNRSVITIAGEPESIGQAAIRGVEAAVQRIDMTTHTGEHPRLGAADVVPFIPIGGVTLDECVQIARGVGKEIAERFGIPVYLYEAAATRPECANLENIRKGQFEGLRDEIETNPGRKPDFGGPLIHPTAGATVVGARKPLIAYNINLNTPDVNVAKEIAKRIRSSSGGFPCVKAMGVRLKDRNQAQVSMNLTDYERTSIAVVFDAVQREAGSHGLDIASSEIVGLIPQKALDQVAAAYLKVENFRPSMILENRLAEVTSYSLARAGSDTVRAFVERIATPQPVPGGGSVAALAGALGVALGQMAIEITRTKKNYQGSATRYSDALSRLTAYRTTLLELVDADAAAYGRVTEAYRIPKDSPGREEAIQNALIHATEVPGRTATHAAEALRVLENLQPVIHPNVASDLTVGFQMLRSAVEGGIANMRINLRDIKDHGERTRFEDMIREMEGGMISS
jgi:glutamate formiminotransferase/formiminotetrahydrofolate cyclodeaminase